MASHRNQDLHAGSAYFAPLVTLQSVGMLIGTLLVLAALSGFFSSIGFRCGPDPVLLRSLPMVSMCNRLAATDLEHSVMRVHISQPKRSVKVMKNRH